MSVPGREWGGLCCGPPALFALKKGQEARKWGELLAGQEQTWHCAASLVASACVGTTRQKPHLVILWAPPL